MQCSDDFVGWIVGKMNRVCCGAVNFSWASPHGSGGSHGDNQPLSVAAFKMNTTTSCGWLQADPQKQRDLWQRISRIERCIKIIWKNYCGKAVIVGLIGGCLSCFFYLQLQWWPLGDCDWSGLKRAFIICCSASCPRRSQRPQRTIWWVCRDKL